MKTASKGPRAALVAVLVGLALGGCGGNDEDEQGATAAALQPALGGPAESAQAAAPATPRIAERDGDGVPDFVDNCIDVANPDQRDTDADGIGNACDADLDNNGRVDFADLGLLRQAFLARRTDARYNPHADFNGDGQINFADLAVMRAAIFRRPGPAGTEAAGSRAGPAAPELALTASARARCTAGVSHELSLSWALEPALAGIRIELDVLGPDGQQATHEATLASGTVALSLVAQRGGPAQVIGRALWPADPGAPVARTRLPLLLTPCIDDPAPQPPTLGFTPAPDDEPPIIGAPNGRPREVDIVHLGGSPSGPTAARLVVAAGTGAGYKLFSFAQPSDQAPDLLAEAGPFAGRIVKLHVLAPALSPKLTVAPFVTGVLRDDQNLWLTAWTVGNAGAMQRFGQRGYGANAGVQVEAFAIAQRELSNGNHQVVTVIRHTAGGTAPGQGPEVPRLRLVSWEVTAAGDVLGRADSGDFGEPNALLPVSVTHLRENLYVVHYLRAQGERLISHYWRVSQNGVPTDATGSTGLNHDGDAAIERIGLAVIGLPIATDDVVTPVWGAAGLEMLTWETRGGGNPADPAYLAYLISDDDIDESAQQLGVQLTPPTLSNALDANNSFIANVRGRLTEGAQTLFDLMPPGEQALNHMASVTKNMVLLLAVEAIAANQAGLDDPVTVSEAAAAIGGSQMGMVSGTTDDDLQAGEVQTLRTLLHGMMLRSGNDAAAAIAEHLAGPGNFAAFVATMNQRAAQLGMTQTVYGETDSAAGAPAGGGLSTPGDQITLLRFGVQLPLFAEVATVRAYSGCGTAADGQPRCYNLTKLADSGYAGLESWKGGNGGFSIDPDFHPYTANGGPYCVGSGCLAAQALRLDRSLFVGLQQSGNRWGDADALFRYGYRRIFTPDRRALALDALPDVRDFGLDNVSDNLGITVDLRGGVDTFQVCAWGVSADVGQIVGVGCRAVGLAGVAASLAPLPPKRLDGSRLSTLLADGDFFIGNRDGNGDLSLSLWRVGRRLP